MHALYYSRRADEGEGEFSRSTWPSRHWTGVRLRAGTQESTLWQLRPPRQSGNDEWWLQTTTTTAATATTVPRRTLWERGQRRSFHKYSAPCHARSLSVHGIFVTPPPPREPMVYTPPRPANHPTGTKYASLPHFIDFHRARAPFYTYNARRRAHESNAATERRWSDVKKKHVEILRDREKREKQFSHNS